jgi:RNA polymerase sigma-70 factor, ECF subfamily
VFGVITSVSSGATAEAIERIYREHSRNFFRFAFAVTGERELAHDAVQEGFARAIRAATGFRGSGSLDGWLARCVINAARDMVNAQRISTPLDEGHEPAAFSHTVDDHLRDLVRSLPARQREALFLRFYLDLDYKAISEALGIEIGTVSATLHAARTELARALQEVRA